MRTYNMGTFAGVSIETKRHKRTFLQWISGHHKCADLILSFKYILTENNVTPGDKIDTDDGNQFIITDISSNTVEYTSAFIHKVCDVGSNIFRIKGILSAYRPTGTTLVIKK